MHFSALLTASLTPLLALANPAVLPVGGILAVPSVPAVPIVTIPAVVPASVASLASSALATLPVSVPVAIPTVVPTPTAAAIPAGLIPGLALAPADVFEDVTAASNILSIVTTLLNPSILTGNMNAAVPVGSLGSLGIDGRLVTLLINIAASLLKLPPVGS